MVPDWWLKFRAFDKRGLLADRVEGSKAFTSKGYVIDRRIFRWYFFGLVLPMIVVLMVVSDVGWREAYVSCPVEATGPCENWCFQGGDRCGAAQFVETLSPGESIGIAPSPEFERQVRGVWWVVVSGALLALILNHVWHNRGRRVSDLLPGLEDEE